MRDKNNQQGGKYNHYIFAPGILEVYSASPKLYDFKFGIPWICERRISSNSSPCRVSLEWREVKNVRDYMKTLRLNPEPNGKGIPYIFEETPLFFGKKAQLFLRWGGDKFNAQLVTNRDYFRWSLLRLTSDSHHPLPGTILSDVAYVSLLEDNYLPMHCGCVDFNKTGVILVAPSDTGKTSTTQMLVQSYGFKFVAEDIAITDGKEITGCAYTGTGIPDKKPSVGFLEKIRRTLFYPLFKQGFYHRESLAAELGQSLIVSKTNADYIVFLKRGKDQITEVNKQEASNLLLKSIRLEFRYLADIFILQLWHQYDIPNLQKTMEKEKEIISFLVNQSKAILSVSAKSPNGFAYQINHFIKEKSK